MIGLKNRGLFKGHRSALATIFLESNPTSLPITSILHIESNSYWKTITYTSIQNIISLIQRESLTGGKFVEIIIYEINEGSELYFFDKRKRLEKRLVIFAQGVFLDYKVWMLNQVLQKIDLPFSVEAINCRSMNKSKHLFRKFLGRSLYCG
jgi:hypothetical protein